MCYPITLLGGLLDRHAGSRSQSGYNIYLDFAKAFDSVPHERLLEKVKGYRIRGDILEWIRLFIKKRNSRGSLSIMETSEHGST